MSFAQSPLGQLILQLQEVPDPRQRRRPRHQFIDILVIGLLSTLTGGRSFRDMRECGQIWEGWLREKLALQLPCGIPCEDTFERVLAAVDPHELSAAFAQWAGRLELPAAPSVPQPPRGAPSDPAAHLRHLAVDGKAVRGSRGEGARPVLLVNAWLVEQGLCLGQRRVPPGCSETVQLPFLLRCLHLEKSVLSADAAHAQPDTASLIVRRGGDYLLCIKGSQPATLAALQAHFAAAPQHSLHSDQSVDKGHGRVEERRCTVSHAVAQLPVRGCWSGLNAVIKLESEVSFPGTDRKPRTACRYFISSLKAGPQILGRIIRNHWHIENRLHWVLDMHFGEDACRARKRYAAATLAHLRKMALNLLHLHPGTSKNMPLRTKMYAASISTEFLLQLLKPLRLNTVS